MKDRLALIAVVALLAFGISSNVSTAAGPDGKAIFASKCATCHQQSGEGIAGTFPPLANNKDVTAKDPKRIIGIVKHGLSTPIKVNGREYPGGMPPWQGQLSNAEIAAVLTFVRSSWGNHAPAVTEKEVAAVK